MSIESMIKDLRDIKIYLMKYHLDDRSKLQIKYDEKNIINLDDQEFCNPDETELQINNISIDSNSKFTYGVTAKT